MKLKIRLRRILFILVAIVIYQTILFCLIPKNLNSNELTLAHNMAFASVGSFSDLPSTHPNYEAIEYTKTHNIVEGYADGTFRPNDLINRAEFTKIIIEAYYSEQANGSDCFPDVSKQWFAKYVCFAKGSHFITGYPDGDFKPANNINFAESAKILVNIKGLSITPDPITWYKPYVEKLAEISTIPTSITSFNQEVTRGEVAEMIYRLNENITDKPSITYQEIASAGLPTQLRIPGINVNATIESVGLTPEGAVGIPNDPKNAAWYNVGPRPGEIGSAVITGHINWYYGAIGVFANLRQVKPGDKIIIQDDKGVDIPFVVRETRNYAATADAIDVFYANDGKAHLNLITCEGVWNKFARQYTERLVVFTDLETDQ